MKALASLALILGMLLFGCAQTYPPGNNTTVVPPANNTTISPPANNTTISPPGNGSVPSGYEVKDYCVRDSDCVRLDKCCDCGLGEYVNIYHQGSCNGPRCMCASANSRGACRDNHCVAVPADQGSNHTSGFCGMSTNAACASDSDCARGGCSNQVCQSKAEPPVITDCMYSDCYDADAYNVSCGCNGGKCGWR